MHFFVVTEQSIVDVTHKVMLRDGLLGTCHLYPVIAGVLWDVALPVLLCRPRACAHGHVHGAGDPLFQVQTRQDA